MGITTLVGGEVENMGIPHYSEPNWRVTRKRDRPHKKSYHVEVNEKI